MARTRRRVPSEWTNTPRSKTMPPRVVEAIARRRRQMLIHSYLYYKMDAPTIDDHKWSKWAQQLAALQQKFGWKIGFYDSVFQSWGGSSGFHLHADENVERVAARVLDYHTELTELLS